MEDFGKQLESIEDNSIMLCRTIIEELLSGCENCERKNLRFKVNQDLNSIEIKLAILGKISTVRRLNENILKYELNSDVIIATNRSSFKLPRVSDHLFEYLKFKIIDLENIDASEVISLSDTFRLVESDEIKFTGWNTPNLKIMSNTFFKTKIKRLDLSKLDFTKVTSLKGAFMRAIIKNLNLKSLYAPYLSTIEDAFYMCETPEVDLSTFKSIQLNNISHAFYDCIIDKVSLRDIKIDESAITTSFVRIAKIKELDLVGFNLENMWNGVDIFLRTATEIIKVTREQNKLIHEKMIVPDSEIIIVD